MKPKSKRVRTVVLTLCTPFVFQHVLYAVDPTIHVQWDGGGTPEEGIDYTVDTGFPAFPDLPDVKLLTGSDSWRVWSTDADEPDGVGNIGFITCPRPENFAVRIEDDQSGPGAKHVRGIILEPTDDANWSRIAGGHITGDVADNISVQRSTSEIGGEIAFQIDGFALGEIAAAEVSTLTIGQDALGAITIGELADGGAVSVGAYLQAELWIGRVGSTALVTIGRNAEADVTMLQMKPQSGLVIEGSVPEDVTIFAQLNHLCLLHLNADVVLLGTDETTAGRIELTAGIPYHATVAVSGDFSGPNAVINMHGEDMDGSLTIAEGDGSLIGGGHVREAYWSALWGVFLGVEGKTFGGSATFAGVGSDGQIVMAGADLAGDLVIEGDMAGWMDIFPVGGQGGTITEEGSLTITGVLHDALYVRGDVDGEISIGGPSANDMVGEVRLLKDVNGAVELTGDLQGILTIQEALNGELCAANLSATEPLPSDRVYVGSFGPGASICTVENDCGAAANAATTPMAFQEYVAKNRYISFVPGNSGQSVAIRVRLAEMPDFQPDFSEFNGHYRWVGPTESYSEVGSGSFMAAPLLCDPYYTYWGSVGTLHVFGAEVVPDAIYDVQLVHQVCGSLLAFENNYSAAYTISDSIWGDVVGSEGVSTAPDGNVNFADISAVVDAFREISGSLIKARAQFQPQVPSPGSPISFADISAVVDAFRSFDYPFVGPVACPSFVACGPGDCDDDDDCPVGRCNMATGDCEDEAKRCTN